ncbi:two-component system response regulator [uncultured Neptuniibacter sp.]|uniref:response regulator n=1 Tax=uncultured Neptuniibacter sp. TaxID=502143 RepID=UPI002627E321|nr:two-component system response regulator [uncultured Neptuniibacter sp.]
MAFNILIVDDEPVNLSLLRQVLGSDYNLFFARNGLEAISRAERCNPDLILLDVMMPEMDGIEACKRLKANPRLTSVPVILVTALSNEENEEKGFAVGAVDYISKPFSPVLVRARVKTQLALYDRRKELENLVQERTQELELSQLAAVRMLGRAAEYKDNETGKHVIRMSQYSRILARTIGWDKTAADLLMHAAPMHDIGKIGIPDSILRKPGALDAGEWEVMRKHPEIGAQIIASQIDLVAESKLLRMAKSIALSHHEKWDGSGYPQGLKGEVIPVEGRIVAIADVFDALTSKRPYKDAWSVEKAIELLVDQSGKHFEPELVEAFMSSIDQVIPIKEQWQD